MGKLIVIIATIFLLNCSLLGKKSLENVSGATTVSVEKVVELMGIYTEKDGKKVRKTLFIDTRKSKDLKNGGTIPGAVHLNIKKQEEFNQVRILTHPKFTGDILVFCNGHSCLRAQNAALKLVSWKAKGLDGGGIKSIYYFRDGFPSYRDHIFDDGSKNPIIMPY